MIKDGKLIRKLRKERNITQEKLVGMHYSRSTIARIESEDLCILPSDAKRHGTSEIPWGGWRYLRDHRQ